MADKTSSWGGWVATQGGASDGWRIKLDVWEIANTSTYITYRIHITSQVHWGIKSQNGNSIKIWWPDTTESHSLSLTDISGLNLYYDHTVYRGTSSKWNYFGVCFTVVNYCPGTSCTSGGSGDCYMYMGAKPYSRSKNPTVTISPKGKPHYKQKINIIAKHNGGGNGSYQYMELWQGLPGKSVKKLQTGNKGAKNVTFTIDPSEITGPTGGTAEYGVWIKDKYDGSIVDGGRTAVTIEVTGGVVTVYDSLGNGKTGLITVYDHLGNAHSALPSCYDHLGNVHDMI